MCLLYILNQIFKKKIKYLNNDNLDFKLTILYRIRRTNFYKIVIEK